jgi:hypothetical protein
MSFILKKQNCKVKTAKIFGATSVTMLYSLIMPGLLSTSVKWYILRQHTGKGSNVFSSMIHNQLTLYILVIITGLIALIVTNPTGNWQFPTICLVILVSLIVAWLSLLNRKIGPKSTQHISNTLDFLPKSFSHKSRRILEQLVVFQKAPWLFHLRILVLDLVGFTIIGTMIYIFAAKAARVDVPVGVLIWQCAVIFTLGRLPISIANLGVREATLIGTLALYGVDESSAFLMSMILFSNVILMAIIGVIHQLTWTITDKKSLEQPTKPIQQIKYPAQS